MFKGVYDRDLAEYRRREGVIQKAELEYGSKSLKDNCLFAKICFALLAEGFMLDTQDWERFKRIRAEKAISLECLTYGSKSLADDCLFARICLDVLSEGFVLDPQDWERYNRIRAEKAVDDPRCKEKIPA